MSKTSQSSYDPGYEALLDACRQGNLKAVRKFIQSGVDQNKPVGAPRGWSPIMATSYHGHLGIVKYLANQGARLDLIEVDGWWTALDLAVHSNQEEIVNYLKSIKAPRGMEIPNPFRRGKLGGWVTDER